MSKSIVTKSMVGLGLVAALGVAALPLTAFADEEFPAAPGSIQVSVSVEESCGFDNSYAGFTEWNDTKGKSIKAGQAITATTDPNEDGDADISTTTAASVTPYLGSTISVKCNDPTGYTLYLNSVTDSDTNPVTTTLTDGMVNPSKSKIIPALADGVAPSAGTEGYSWYTTNCSAIAAANATNCNLGGTTVGAGWTKPIADATGKAIGFNKGVSTAGGDPYSVFYGMGTSLTTPADTYTANVYFALISNTP